MRLQSNQYISAEIKSNEADITRHFNSKKLGVEVLVDQPGQLVKLHLNVIPDGIGV